MLYTLNQGVKVRGLNGFKRGERPGKGERVGGKNNLNA